MEWTFLDLFAGVGGFREGMEGAGYRCIGYCEYDLKAVEAYKCLHNTKGEWYARDIQSVKARDMPRADIWCAGFPCQGNSMAGNRKGLNDSRSGLYKEVIRLLKGTKKEDKPTWLFLENVKGLFSVNGGWDFARILLELDEIGYNTEWSLINSSAFVPQNRERIFIVGHFGERGTRRVFPIIREGKKANNRINVVGNINPSRKGMNGNVYGISGLAPTLTTNKGEGIKILVPRMAIPILTPDRVQTRQNGRRFKTNGEPMFTLTVQDRHGIYDGYKIRRLTPRECFRLQGWRDERIDLIINKFSRSALYRFTGNGVTVPVVKEIGMNFKLMNKKEKRIESVL